MTDDRLMRLEESLAFTERTVESLDAEVRTLGDKVEDMRRALRAIERRIEQLVDDAQAPSEEPSEDA